MIERFRFGKFRQKMCDLLWECDCDHIGLSDETNAKQIFDNAHYICNKLVDDYEIVEKSKEEWENGMTEKRFTMVCMGEDLVELNDKCEFLEIENESLEDGATRYAELYHESLKENEQLRKEISRINQLIDKKIDEFKNGDYGDLPCNTIHMFLDLKEEIGVM